MSNPHDEPDCRKVVAWKPRALLTTALLVGAVAAQLSAPTPAQARSSTISPGDRIDYVTEAGRSSFCTLGYVYTGRDGHTYAITAGHCRGDQPGQVVDNRTAAAGQFLRSTVSPPRSGGPDYGLVDFGPDVTARPAIGALPVATTEPKHPIRVGQTICRAGVSSGQHCGRVAHIYGEHQFLTTGMPASIPGDSGGPVWTVDAAGGAHILGIWLGDKVTGHSGHRYGRFASLADALALLT